MNQSHISKIFKIGLCFLFLIFISMDKKSVIDKKNALLAIAEIRRDHSPYKTFIFGVGVVEAKGGNIYIGAPTNRIVNKVLVTVGSKVKKGDELVIFENRDLQAEVIMQELAYQLAQAQLKKLKNLPQREDLIVSEANYKSAELKHSLAQIQYDMVRNLKDPRALSQEEINRRSFAFQLATAELQQTQAQLDKIKSGAWKPDLDIGQLEVMQAKARIMQSKSNLQKTIIKSPADATVLQIKIHEGEVPSIDTSRLPLMIIGDLSELSLKVSINQFDAPNFNPSSKAVAYLQGDRRHAFPLEFVRLEPILTSKEYLTNDISEKVDTDVLNIIYRILPSNKTLYVGQQMDVYIESETAKDQPKS